jgi:hypothetical protein
MDTSLQKFNDLPRDLRNKISSPEFLKVIDELEGKYAVKLALLFIKLAMEDTSIADFAGELESHGLKPEAISDILGKFSFLLVMFKRYQKEFFSQNQILASEKPDYQSANQSAVAMKPKSQGNPVNQTSLGHTGFAFSSDDEAEVKRFKTPELEGEKIGSYDDLSKMIMSEYGYDDQDEVMKNRLGNIIMANLRDVRDDLETLDSLKKNKKIGGMEFSPDSADKLIAIIKREKNNHASVISRSDQTSRPQIYFPTNKIIEEKPIMSLRDKMAGSAKAQSEPDVIQEPRPIAGNFDSAKAKSTVSLVDLINKEVETGNFKRPSLGNPIALEGQAPKIMMEGGLPIVQMPKIPASNPGQAAGGKSEIKYEPLPPARPIAEPVKSYIPQKSVSSQAVRKPQLDDIKIVKKLVGPVEELSGMTLIDFRRVAENPADRIKKIKEKIELLEQDSFAKRIEGIAAWQKSEVSKFYRLLGQKSMEDGKSVEEIITERLKENKPTLSLDEFHAIMELNKDLRY